MLTPQEIRTIGENRYWNTVAKKLFILVICSTIWAIGCIAIVYSMGMVVNEHTYTIKSYMLETYGSQKEVTVTVENGDAYLQDFRLPEPSKRQDISVPFGILILTPMVITFMYFCYCSFKAGQAGDKLLVSFYEGKTEVAI